MEPLENEHLSEPELDRLLPEWKVPRAPERLRQKVFPGRERWWRGFWSTSIRIPLPVACCLLIVAAAIVWQKQTPTRGVPAVATTSVVTEMPRFEAVRELRPRIIKGQDAQ